MFTEQELEFINGLKFGRIATATPDGKPHVVPGRAHVNNGKVIIPGWEMKRSYKYRQVKKNPWVAVVWDTREPGNNKGVEVRGMGVAVEDPANPDSGYTHRIEMTPTKVFSWGIHENYTESFHIKMGYPANHGGQRPQGAPAAGPSASQAAR